MSSASKLYRMLFAFALPVVLAACQHAGGGGY